MTFSGSAVGETYSCDGIVRDEPTPLFIFLLIENAGDPTGLVNVTTWLHHCIVCCIESSTLASVYRGDIYVYDARYEISAIEEIECARIHWLLCQKVVCMAMAMLW